MIIKNAVVRKEAAGKKSLIISSCPHPVNFSRDILWRNEQQSCCKGEVIILKVSDRLRGKKYCD